MKVEDLRVVVIIGLAEIITIHSLNNQLLIQINLQLDNSSKLKLIINHHLQVTEPEKPKMKKKLTYQHSQLLSLKELKLINKEKISKR